MKMRVYRRGCVENQGLGLIFSPQENSSSTSSGPPLVVTKQQSPERLCAPCGLFRAVSCRTVIDRESMRCHRYHYYFLPRPSRMPPFLLPPCLAASCLSSVAALSWLLLSSSLTEVPAVLVLSSYIFARRTSSFARPCSASVRGALDRPPLCEPTRARTQHRQRRVAETIVNKNKK